MKLISTNCGKDEKKLIYKCYDFMPGQLNQKEQTEKRLGRRLAKWKTWKLTVPVCQQYQK